MHSCHVYSITVSTRHIMKLCLLCSRPNRSQITTMVFSEPLFFIRSPKTHSPSSQLIHKTKSKFEKKLDMLFVVVVFISVNSVQGCNIATVTFVMSFIANTKKMPLRNSFINF